jgi:transposase
MTNVNFSDFISIASDENRSFEYFCNRLTALSCPRCGQREFYVMTRKRLRCKVCRKDPKPLKETKLTFLNLSSSEWLSLIKLFELSVSARKVSQELHISYKTALKGFDIVRTSIVESLSKSDEILKGEIELDESYFGGKRKDKRGRSAGGKTIVFGILERGGKVSVSIVKDVKAESLLGEIVKRVRRGSIVFTDQWKGYDSLMICGYKHLNIDHQLKFKQGKVYINGVEGFWSFAKERLIKHLGISKEKFLYYIKEMEWRYNNRGKDLYADLVDLMLT